jgi:hypothetical protein
MAEGGSARKGHPTPLDWRNAPRRRDGSLNAKDNFAVEERSRNYRWRRAPFHPEGWVGGGWSGG